MPEWAILLGSVGRMYSRVRFSRWRQSLSGAPGRAAAAGLLAAVLAVLLGFGAAGALTPSGPAGRVSAPGAGLAGLAGAAGGSAAAAQPAGPGARASGASGHDAARSGASGSGGSASGRAKPGAGRPGTTTAGGSRPGTSRAGVSGSSAGRPSGHGASGHGSPGQGSPGRGAAPARAAAAGPGTSCRSVAHIGDSTSVGLVSPLDLPDPAQRLAAQYAGVGVRHAWIDASGGRSMVEEMPGQVNGYDTARSMVSQGFRGCWVVALGTNDTANVSVGSGVGRMARIQELMSVAHGAPVMWVNVKTLDSSGPWSEANMQLWNDTLLQACHQYPNLRIFDWASATQDGWFISDGIHYTPAGYAARAHLIAGALARAFPRSGSSTGCVIH
jgi:hypothetical protein